jgi:DNA-binding NtrC family response regulator
MATILYIEDDRVSSTALINAVARLGHEVEPASSVGEGLKALDRHDVDLIISDSLTPGAAGLTLLDALRRRGSRVPVIIVTGTSNVESAIVSMQRGATDYLVRPFCLATLRRAVASALQVGEPDHGLALARK